MRQKIVVLVVLLLIVVVGCHKSETRVVVDGALITIASGSHHIEGTLEPESTFQLLMKDEGVAVNTFSGDAFVTVLPLKTAEQLRAQYGDFFRCTAPGAVQGMQSMRPVVLVTDGEPAKEAISQALGLVRKSRIPVVSFTGSRIQAKNVTYLGMKVQDHAGPWLFYVKELKVLKQDYLQ